MSPPPPRPEPAPPPVTDPAVFRAILRGQREAARRQASLRGEYLQALAADAEQRAASGRALVIGAVALAIGLVVTAATYAHAGTDGGVYVLAWGPIVFGLVQIVRGLAARPPA
jgi:hypothetical protein